MYIWKILKKIFIITSLSLLLLVIAGIVFVYIKKDEIIQYALSEANKYIATPISVNKIDISIFRYFPRAAVELQQVTVKSGDGPLDTQIAKAQRVSFSLNTLELIRKTYVINGLHIENAELDLTVDKSGKANYMILKSDEKGKGGFFEIKNITAGNVKVRYTDIRSDYYLSFLIKGASAGLNQKGRQMTVTVKSDLISDEIRVAERKFANNKTIEISSHIEYSLDDKKYTFLPTSLKIDKGEFELQGNVNLSTKTMNLDVKAVNTSFKTINSLLSDDLSTYFKDYDSKGEVYFNGQITGRYDAPNLPTVSMSFGAKNASFFHPKFKKEIRNVTLVGQFSTGNANNPKNYSLSLKDFHCTLDDKELSGDLIVTDFADYHIDLRLKGEADINTLLLLLPEKYVRTAFGTVRLNVRLKGPVNNPQLSKNFRADGDLELQNLSMVLTGERLPINKVNGMLSLRSNDLAVSDLSGYIGQSDFVLNGFVRQFGPLFLTANSPILVEADLKSNNLNFDELLKSNFAFRDTASTNTPTYEFGISPRINLTFNCDISHLNFKRFHGRNIKGQLAVRQRIALLKNVSFHSMGGRINIGGYVNNKNPNLVETIADANISALNIDSVFYVFNNFNQNWLIDKNLKGHVTARVNLYMNLNKNLVLNTNSFIADIEAAIDNGELNNFEPIMALSKFVEEESLAQMRFSKMTNKIKIENRTIYLPQMEIRSNVSNIQINGTHTFDHVIDYHLSVPLKNFLKVSKRKDFTENATQGINLLLKITGTTTDYKIALDSKAMAESIKRDIKDERQEWKKILDKTSRAAEDAPELEDEYFDFDDSEKKSPN